jgi:hypothetical protein
LPSLLDNYKLVPQRGRKDQIWILYHSLPFVYNLFPKCITIFPQICCTGIRTKFGKSENFSTFNKQYTSICSSNIQFADFLLQCKIFDKQNLPLQFYPWPQSKLNVKSLQVFSLTFSSIIHIHLDKVENNFEILFEVK